MFWNSNNKNFYKKKKKDNHNLIWQKCFCHEQENIKLYIDLATTHTIFSLRTVYINEPDADGEKRNLEKQVIWYT
jgi:hypothetical protein